MKQDKIIKLATKYGFNITISLFFDNKNYGTLTLWRTKNLEDSKTFTFSEIKGRDKEKIIKVSDIEYNFDSVVNYMKHIKFMERNIIKR